jgi:hydroxyethylthiazole kinase
LIENGTPMLGAITGTGCMVSGLVAACAVLPSDPLLAAGAALLVFGVAGEVAARAATGPGSLRVALLDALYILDETTYRRYGKARWS